MDKGVNSEVSIRTPGVFAISKSNASYSCKYLAIPELDENNPAEYIACGPGHSAVVCRNGSVFTFGDNSYGRLGLGLDIEKTTEPTLITKLSSTHIVQVACGKFCTFFVSKLGEVYVCGRTDNGQLGLGTESNAPFPVLVADIPPMKNVKVGLGHAVALSNTGDVWVTGCYLDRRQLHANHHIPKTFIPVPNITGPFKDISCGLSHTALLSECGDIFVAGWNDFGLLGFGQLAVVDGFKHLPFPLPIISVTCGAMHTAAATIDGKVFGWGFNKEGQIGTGDRICRFFPTRMVSLENFDVCKVVAGSFCTALFTGNGEVFFRGLGPLCHEFRSAQTRFWETHKMSSAMAVDQLAFGLRVTLVLIKSKQSDKILIVTLTNLEKNILKSLECARCYSHMCTPIHMCATGHNFCGSCRSDISDCSLCHKQFTETRNTALESISLEMQIPCFDCSEHVQLHLLQEHRKICVGRKYDCPCQFTCNWKGRAQAMLEHIRSQHLYQTREVFPALYVHSITITDVITDVLIVGDKIFTLHRQYNNTSKSFCVAARHFGNPKNGTKYELEIEFIASDNDFNKTFRLKMCADTEPIPQLFQSPTHCISLNHKECNKFLSGDMYVFRVAVVMEQNAQVAVNPVVGNA